ncbi:MAG: nitrilase-related carbon-nitrogen hydrolase [Planctomycetota bacterium]
MQRTITLVQMDCVEGARRRNHSAVAEATAQARHEKADLLALPELWCSGYDLARSTQDRERAEQEAREDSRFLEQLSQPGPALLGGSLLEPVPGGFHNTAVAYEDGKQLARYHKLHLFGPLDENRYLKPGKTAPQPFLIAGVRSALTVCYDLRFPEVYRSLALAGVELIHVPAQWPRDRIQHWRTLLVARAIECQCFLVGVNRLGRFGDIEFGGNSLLVSPTGEIIIDTGEETGVFTGVIDTGEVEELRRRFPYLQDRRADLYPFPGAEG